MLLQLKNYHAHVKPIQAAETSKAPLPQTSIHPSNAAGVNGNALVNKGLQEPRVTMISKGVLTVQLLLD